MKRKLVVTPRAIDKLMRISEIQTSRRSPCLLSQTMTVIKLYFEFFLLFHACEGGGEGGRKREHYSSLTLTKRDLSSPE